MRHLILRIGALVVAVGLVACGSDATTAPIEEPIAAAPDKESPKEGFAGPAAELKAHYPLDQLPTAPSLAPMEQPPVEEPPVEEPPVEEPPVEEPPVEEPMEPVVGEMGEGQAVDLLPVVEAATRSRKRMNIDQLSSSISNVLKGNTWKLGNADQFEALAGTLGKPNYLDLTNEDLEPTALFQKFLDDAARSACAAAAAQDTGVLVEDRALLRHVSATDTLATAPEKVMQNLKELLLVFHGKDVADGDPLLAPFQWLYTASEKVAGDPVVAWQTVCVGLIVHPDFYTY